MKLVCDSKYRQLLGVHMIGPHVTELIAEGTALVGLEAVASCAFLSLALPGSAFAQSAAKPLFANASANVQCTVTGTDVFVDAGLIQ